MRWSANSLACARLCRFPVLKGSRMSRKPPRALRLGLCLYFAAALFVFTPYYSWQYARGRSRSSLRIGFIIPTAKAFAWPYFAVSDLRARRRNTAAEDYFQSVNFIRAGHRSMSAMVADARKLVEEKE